MRLLLHACCGPCTLEPLRLLLEEGHSIVLAYMNSNIQPQAEYCQRKDTLLGFALDQGIEVIEGAYEPKEWLSAVGPYTKDPKLRPQRCRTCYRLRLDEACRYAAEQGFEGVATTLTVSPYQYLDAIREELEEACAPYGLVPVFRDYTEHYPEATRRSKELGMYRQNYCGCVFSKAEAAQERETRRAERAAAKAAKKEASASARAAAWAQRAQKRAERDAYAKKRAAQRAALKAYKQAQASGVHEGAQVAGACEEGQLAKIRETAQAGGVRERMDA